MRLGTRQRNGGESSPGIARAWGTSPSERDSGYPCDAYLPEAEEEYFRGVDVRADPSVIFRWLCQLKLAPYSYDWIDNFGRRSPERWIPGQEELATGQRIMTIFRLVEFERDEHLTFLLVSRWAVRMFGEISGTYRVAATPDGGSRLLVKLRLKYPGGPYGWLVARLLPWGDLVMMRKQLMTFRRLAEATLPPG